MVEFPFTLDLSDYVINHELPNKCLENITDINCTKIPYEELEKYFGVEKNNK